MFENQKYRALWEILSQIHYADSKAYLTILMITPHQLTDTSSSGY